MKPKFWIHLANVLCAAAVSIWAFVAAHQVTLSGVALGASALCLGETLYLVFRALHSVSQPATTSVDTSLSAERRRELEREKYYLLKAIKELDFDFEMGKLAAVDHQSIGANYRARAIRVLRLLDTSGSDEGYREMIARELKLRRKNSAAAAPVEDNRVPEPLLERRACGSCGASNEPDASFCKKCAQPLASQNGALQ